MRSVGSDLNLLWVGECITLAAAILGLFGLSNGLEGLAGLVSLILSMMALGRLRGSHPGYGRAFSFMVLNIVFAVASVVLLFVAVASVELLFVAVEIPVLMTVVVSLMTVGSNILNYCVVRCLCLATADLVEEAGDGDTAALGRLINKVYLVCAAVSVVGTILGILPVLGKAFHILTKLVSLTSVVGVALLVYFLYRAKVRLA